MNDKLAGEKLKQDPRVAEAKRLLLETVRSHQEQITKIRPPEPELKQSYEKTLEEFSHCRGAKLWFPFVGSGLGNGPLVELLDGSVKYDFICGIGPHFFGHSHPDLILAGVDAALEDTVMQGNLQQNFESLELSKLLIKLSKLDHCFLTTSGAMANENALKIALHKKAPASRILAFERCFIGRTLTLSQITDKAAYREGLPLTAPVDYVPFFDHSNPEESTKKAVETLKKLIARYPKQHAVMCFELAQGEGGFYVGTQHFFKALMEVLKDNEIAVFDDEIQSFGRTEQMFAFRYFGLDDYVDIVTIGKLSQVCATIYRSNFKPNLGLLGQTFTGSTSSIHAALTIINHLDKNEYYGPEGKIAQINRHFVTRLEEMSRRHPQLIRGPFGIGSMIAFTPLDGDAARVTQFAHRLFDAGVMTFIAGANPTRIRMLVPAGAVIFEDIDRVSCIIEETLLKS